MYSLINPLINMLWTESLLAELDRRFSHKAMALSVACDAVLGKKVAFLH